MFTGLLNMFAGLLHIFAKLMKVPGGLVKRIVAVQPNNAPHIICTGSTSQEMITSCGKVIAWITRWMCCERERILVERSMS